MRTRHRHTRHMPTPRAPRLARWWRMRPHSLLAPWSTPPEQRTRCPTRVRTRGLSIRVRRVWVKNVSFERATAEDSCYIVPSTKVPGTNNGRNELSAGPAGCLGKGDGHCGYSVYTLLQSSASVNCFQFSCYSIASFFFFVYNCVPPDKQQQLSQISRCELPPIHVVEISCL